MYRKKGRSWTKHIDFMLLDVLCMQIAFIVSYICRFGLNNPYIDKDYRILAVAFLLIDFFVEIVSDAFKNVLKRGYLDEFIVTCKHVALVEIITTFFLFTTQMGEIYSRMSYYIMIPIYILVSYLGRMVLKKIIKKRGFASSKESLFVIAPEKLLRETLQGLKENGFGYTQIVAAATDADLNGKGELYSLPFNMYTFNKMWGVVTPEEAAAKIEEQRKEITGEPQNLEEQAISLVGRDIYEKLIKGYTEKQWGRDCKELPSFIIKRLPVRLTFDNNYFNALYQGIPVGGYTKMIANLLDGVEVRLNTDYLENKAELDALADKVVYTGPIDAYFDYKLGTLEYRSVRFETETLDKPNFQGNAAVNYTDRETPWTRIIEHKWFEFGKDENENDLPKTIISREYSSEWKPGDEPYYPVNDAKNSLLYSEYKKLADAEEKVIFGGRLGEYKYYDMDQVIAAVLDKCAKELGE